MGIVEMEEALTLLQRHPELSEFSGPRNDALVSAAEEVLGVTFPPTYRRFLRELGVGSIRGAEIYGIVTSDFVHSSVPDAIWLTLKWRREHGLPRSIVLIYSDGYGEYYGLDTSMRSNAGECPVGVWDDTFYATVEDFGIFFRDLVRAALESEESENG